MIHEDILRLDSSITSVVSLHCVSFGGHVFSRPGVDPHVANSDWPDEEELKSKALTTILEPTSVRDKVLDGLRAHPNVFEVEHLEPSSGRFWSNISFGLVEWPTERVRIGIPATQQRGPFLGEQTIESFHVLTRGSNFCAYAEVDSLQARTHIGQEYAHLLCNVLSEHGDLRATRVGPTPIHPVAYVARVRRSEGHSIPPNDLLYGGLRSRDILVLVDADHSADDAISVLFARSSLALFSFHYAILARANAIKSVENVLLGFHDISEASEHLSSIPWWRLLKSSCFVSGVKEAISNVYNLLIIAEHSKARLHEAARALDKALDDNCPLTCSASYFEEHVRLDFDVPTQLVSALPHFASVASAKDTGQVALIASLIGAAAGSILTALLSALGQK